MPGLALVSANGVSRDNVGAESIDDAEVPEPRDDNPERGSRRHVERAASLRIAGYERLPNAGDRSVEQRLRDSSHMPPAPDDVPGACDHTLVDGTEAIVGLH